MLKIKEQSQDKLILEKHPIFYYIFNLGLLVLSISSFLLILHRAGLLLALLSAFAILLLAVICLRIAGTTTSIEINSQKQALYYKKSGLFLRKIKKYYFFEIKGFSVVFNKAIDDANKKQHGVFLEKSTGSYKLLIPTHDKNYADELVKKMNDYLFINNKTDQFSLQES